MSQPPDAGRPTPVRALSIDGGSVACEGWVLVDKLTSFDLPNDQASIEHELSSLIVSRDMPGLQDSERIQLEPDNNDAISKDLGMSKPAEGRPVLKAFPHTTVQLNEDGDEYLYSETDLDGEDKISKDGHLLDARKYRCRTFQVHGRGQKLFMLAIECARVQGYGDDHMLFNKHRSLLKIIASQAEKDDPIQQEILPYSYRTGKKIAMVTARSVFREFGARIVEAGRRMRDD